MKLWLKVQLPRIPQSSKFAETIRYALIRWTGLTLIIHNVRIELDSDPVERAIRPSRWAAVASLVESASPTD